VVKPLLALLALEDASTVEAARVIKTLAAAKRLPGAAAAAWEVAKAIHNDELMTPQVVPFAPYHQQSVATPQAARG
jgi:hypothetical protein